MHTVVSISLGHLAMRSESSMSLIYYCLVELGCRYRHVTFWGLAATHNLKGRKDFQSRDRRSLGPFHPYLAHA